MANSACLSKINTTTDSRTYKCFHEEQIYYREKGRNWWKKGYYDRNWKNYRCSQYKNK